LLDAGLAGFDLHGRELDECKRPSKDEVVRSNSDER
jgi:hypothetical protein